MTAVDNAIVCTTPISFDNPNPGAIFAAGITSSRARTTIDWGMPKKPRPTPGLVDSPLRLININDVQACGENLLAAAMVTDIRRCTEGANPISKIKRDGFTLVARSIDYWKKHFNVTSDSKVRTAITHMKDSGLVVCGDNWFNGNLTPHYRMASTGVEINIPPVEINTPLVEIDTPITQKVKAKVEAEKSKSTSVTEKSPVTTGTTPEGLQANSGETEPQNQTKATATPKAVPVESMKTKAKTETSPEAVEKGPPSKIIGQWQADFEGQYATVPFVLPSQITCKNFNRDVNAKVRAAGCDPRLFVTFVIKQWDDLRCGLKLSVYPDMAQVVLNIGPMIQRYAEHLAAEQKAAESAAHWAAVAAEKAEQKAAQPKVGPTPSPAPAVASKHVKTDPDVLKNLIAKMEAGESLDDEAPPEPEVIESPAVDPRIAERAAAYRQWLAEQQARALATLKAKIAA